MRQGEELRFPIIKLDTNGYLLLGTVLWHGLQRELLARVGGIEMKEVCWRQPSFYVCMKAEGSVAMHDTVCQTPCSALQLPLFLFLFSNCFTFTYACVFVCVCVCVCVCVFVCVQLINAFELLLIVTGNSLA